MRLKILIFLAVLVIAISLGSHARADFLGLAPGDYKITLQDVNIRPLLNNLTGQVHIPVDPVTVSNFDWHFPILDVAGPVLFDWTGPVRQIGQGGFALEEATGPLRVCDVGALCRPIFELWYIPNRTTGICAEGACERFWRSPYNYLTFSSGGWSAERIPEVSTLWQIATGIVCLFALRRFSAEAQ